MSKERRDEKINELVKLVKTKNLPQIVLDSFENYFSNRFFDLEISNETLISRASLCYKEHSELIKKLPQDVSIAFIYDCCGHEDKKDEIVSNYDYYKGYKDIFYLLHEPLMSSVFVIYNGACMQKDRGKYGDSDFSWGAIDLTGHEDMFYEKKRISSNALQTADVIIKAVFPNDEKKLNLMQLFLESFLANRSTYQSNSSFSKQDVLEWYYELNLIKRVCLEQRITYKEFGEEVGFGEGAIKNAAASGKISDQLKRATEMYLEIKKLTQENEKFKLFQKLMQEMISLE